MNNVLRVLTRNSLIELTRSSPVTFRPPLYYGVRFAGHAKWQNIKSTKEANDLARGQMINRIVLSIRRAIISCGRQTDPKLNNKLAAVLAEGKRANVPKATMDRAIERAANIKSIQTTLDIQGPGKCSMIVRVEVDDLRLFKKEAKRITKEHDSAILSSGTLTNMFKSRGIVRASSKLNDGTEISPDLAEEAAIIANAEEVYKDSPPDDGWVFITDEANMNSCKGELEKFRFVVESVDLELEAHNRIDFGPKVYESVTQMEQKFRDLDGCLGVYHNVKAPTDS